MILTEDDITRLTKKRRHDAQARELTRLGVIHKQRADGSLVVAQEHVENVLGVFRQKSVRVKTVPNWAAL